MQGRCPLNSVRLNHSLRRLCVHLQAASSTTALQKSRFRNLAKLSLLARQLLAKGTTLDTASGLPIRILYPRGSWHRQALESCISLSGATSPRAGWRRLSVSTTTVARWHRPYSPYPSSRGTAPARGSAPTAITARAASVSMPTIRAACSTLWLTPTYTERTSSCSWRARTGYMARGMQQAQFSNPYPYISERVEK